MSTTPAITPAIEKQIVKQKVLYGLSSKKIAEIFGVSIRQIYKIWVAHRKRRTVVGINNPKQRLQKPQPRKKSQELQCYETLVIPPSITHTLFGAFEEAKNQSLLTNLSTPMPSYPLLSSINPNLPQTPRKIRYTKASILYSFSLSMLTYYRLVYQTKDIHWEGLD